MVASLWSGTWFASQLPLNQIEATASNVRKLRYVIIARHSNCVAKHRNTETREAIKSYVSATSRIGHKR
jgi:DNA-binding FrmR family transcriptional regulator